MTDDVQTEAQVKAEADYQRKAAALAAITDLNFGDVTRFFAEKNEEPFAVGLARDQWEKEGEIEIDDYAIVSNGSDNGAYVMAWVWVDYADTEYDKDLKDEEEESNDD